MPRLILTMLCSITLATAMGAHAGVDLRVTKTVDFPTRAYGETNTYHITLENIGDATANNILVEDLLPDDVRFLSFVASTGAYQTGTGLWPLSSLAALASATLDIDVIVAPSLCRVGALRVPDPTPDEAHATTCAALSDGRWLSGAPLASVGAIARAGEVALFDTNGAYIATLSNNVPALNRRFGSSAAGLAGGDLAIGVPYEPQGFSPASGEISLFDSSGSFQGSITNPVPAFNDYFGSVLAAVANRTLLAAGVPSASSGGQSDAGRVYVFNTDGDLLSSIDDPAPNAGDGFGSAIAPLSSDMMIVGESRFDTNALFDIGAVHVLTTNGAPVFGFVDAGLNSGSELGYAVTAVTTNRFAVGAPFAQQSNSANVGQVYLLDLSLGLVAELTSPNPIGGGGFGSALAQGRDGRFYVGEPGATNAAGTVSGAVHVFREDGRHLRTLLRPGPLQGDQFGARLASVPETALLVGAPGASPRDQFGAGLALLYEARENAGCGAEIQNVARVKSIDEVDAVATNDWDSATFFGGSQAQLMLSKTTSSNIAAYGSAIPYLITVSNAGPAAATGVVIAEPLAAGLNAGDASASTGDVSLASQTWTIDRLAVGATATLTLNASAADSLVAAQRIINPSPVSFAAFGERVARGPAATLLAGAPDADPGAVLGAGAVYLYSSNGVLQAEIPSPIALTDLNFGADVAALPSGELVVGASGFAVGSAAAAGAVCLVDTNGTLLSVITNPAPAASDLFGARVRSYGSERLMVGVPLDDVGATIDAGIAYVFGTNGALVEAITNPSPHLLDWFGHDLLWLDTDRIAIAAPLDSAPGPARSGAVYVFATNRTIEATLTSPVPSADSWFGWALARGTDRFLVGEPYSANGGMAHVYALDGSYQFTLTNAAPFAADAFGKSVAVMDSGRLVVAAPEASAGGISESGLVYVFEADGRLAATLRGDGFPLDQYGAALASVGNRLAVGSPGVADVPYGNAGIIDLIAPGLASSVTNSVRVVGQGQYSSNAPSLRASAVTATGSSIAQVKINTYPTADFVNVGGTVSFHVTVTNYGPGAVTNVHIEDILPGLVTAGPQSADVGSVSNGVWRIPQLAAGSNAVLMLDATPNPGSGGSFLTNQALLLERSWAETTTAFHVSTGTAIVNPQLTTIAGPMGTISPSGTVSVAYGSTPAIDVVGDFPFVISSITTNGGPVEIPTNQSAYVVLWSNFTANSTLEASFADGLTIEGVPYSWLVGFAIIDDFDAASFADLDRDGMYTYEEYFADTDPTNQASRLAATEAREVAPGCLEVKWLASTNVTYAIHGGANTDAPPVLLTNGVTASGPIGVATVKVDQASGYFIRISVPEVLAP